MLAALLHGNRDLRVEEVPEPEPGLGEVKLAVAHNGLCGTDLHEYFSGPLACKPAADRHRIMGDLGVEAIDPESVDIVDLIRRRTEALLATLARMDALRWVGPEVISPETAAMAPVDAARVAGERVRSLVASARGR